MKKIMLYISLAMSVLYILAVVMVVMAQDSIKVQYGIQFETPFTIPTEDLIVSCVFAAITIVFAILLMRAENAMKTTVEISALIVLVVVFVGAPFLENIAVVMHNIHYASRGTEQLAAYSVVRSAMGWCRPILIFAQVLLITYAGISLGRKERV